MTAMQALQSFWSGFDLSAYDAYTVPDDTPFPYITYEGIEDFFDNSVASTASLWYYTTSWAEITEKEAQIADYIGRGGRMVTFDNGAFWIKRGSPWAQRFDDSSDRMIRRIILNIEIEFIK